MNDTRQLTISSKTLIREARKRGYKVQLIYKETGLVKISKHNKLIYGMRTNLPLNTQISSKIAANKDLTNAVLAINKIPVPKQTKCYSLKDLENFCEKNKKIQYVIKPVDLSGGRDVYTDINNVKQVIKIAKKLFEKYQSLLIEEYIEGKDFRLMIVDGKFVSCVYRMPANVRGDGKHTIQKLVEIENKNPMRSRSDVNILKTIKIDEASIKYLKQQGYTLNSIPPRGVIVYLKQASNQCQGGEIEVLTQKVHKDFIKMAEEAALALKLKLCGVDIITTDISKSLKESQGCVIEINSSPSVMIHQHPSRGKGDDVGKVIWDAIEKYCFK